MLATKSLPALVRWAVIVALVSALSGCGSLVELAVDVTEAVSPNPQAAAEVVALAASLLGTGVRACGPDKQSTALIPQCPMLGICFTAACVGHDECYGTCGTTQEQCDEDFFWDMAFLCQAGVESSKQPDCYSLAWIYYQAVHRFGSVYFEGSQEQVCADESKDEPSARASVSSVPEFAPFVDNDDDLMPDYWEIEMMLDPTDPADALADSDGDGVVNLAEFTLGSDPYVPDVR